ncbi:hypothetical protein L207DRAFT_203433 [Hyaloscypha variabilis F]|uniref:BZIP domain-containing protein n=1 Tax=Hyaloscypha variabilis (strain UAMH 11265 / GT02V1 / F) TaxID=1149755 RepID=A0A2J6S558_HYAVF|nr:hypothetical protein L207DRAFT_203433 [Hyaloscypha variabilis F]
MSENIQDSFWDPSWYSQDLQSAPYDLDQSSSQDTPDLMGLYNDNDSSAWESTAVDESSEVSTPRAENQHQHEAEHQNRNRRSRTSSRSMDVVQRRREQNRISQMAHRQRSKKQVENLREQLIDCTEYNHNMYRTLQSLGEKTQALAAEIQQALTARPPQPDVEQSRMGSEEAQWLPGSRGDSRTVGQTSTGFIPPRG